MSGVWGAGAGAKTGLSSRLYEPADRRDVDLERLCEVPHGFPLVQQTSD